MDIFVDILFNFYLKIIVKQMIRIKGYTIVVEVNLTHISNYLQAYTIQFSNVYLNFAECVVKAVSGKTSTHMYISNNYDNHGIHVLTLNLI